MALIRFAGVGHSFDGEVVLRDVDLTLGEHRIGIVGANGSGKSTLARMINGLVHPTSGTVTVDEVDVRRDARAVRRRVGFVFTDPDTQIVMPTVREDVAFSLRRHKLDPAVAAERVEAVLERFGIAALADRPSHRLSGGQKQLLALASVLVAEPDIVVADEPTTLLDARNTRIVAEHLAGLRQQVVVVTHDLSLLSDYDRVIVMDEGRVLADGTPAVALDAYRSVLR